MSLGRTKLLALQALVAVVAIAMWVRRLERAHRRHLPAAQVLLLHAVGRGATRVDVVRRRHGQDRRLPPSPSIFRACSAPPIPASARRCGNILLITLTEGVLRLRHRGRGRHSARLLAARNALLSAIFEPYIKMLNALPRVALAPIFMLWLGLGFGPRWHWGSRWCFFIVFFNVYQGVKEVSSRDPGQRPHARHERAPAVRPRLLALGAVVDVLLAAPTLGRFRHHRRRGWRVPGLGRGSRLF